jgi:hypothetical protein
MSADIQVDAAVGRQANCWAAVCTSIASRNVSTTLRKLVIKPSPMRLTMRP